MTRCSFVNVFMQIVSAYYRVKDKSSTKVIPGNLG
jgi:hypothetical protein